MTAAVVDVRGRKRLTEEDVERLNAPRWYVVRTHHARERLAVAHLERKGFEVYLPMRLIRSHAAVRPMPLFPSFVFVKVEPTREAWRPLFSTIGVAEVMCHGDCPAALPVGAVEEIQAREVEGLISISPPPEPDPLPGSTIKVKGTAYDGIDAVFCERVDSRRVLILLRVLGADRRVVMHSEVPS